MFKPQASPPPSEDLTKPFGWDVTVRFHQGADLIEETYHYRGCTEAKARWKARRKAIFKPLSQGAVLVVKSEPISEAAWLRAYGDGRM